MGNALTDHLIKFREEKGLTQPEMADLLEISHRTYQSIEQSGDLKKVKEVLSIKEKTGFDYMQIIASNENNTDFTEHRRNLKNSDKKDELVFYEVGANAGLATTGEILPVKKGEGKLHISDLFKGSQYAIRISGNSMMPNYPPGAIIGIREIPDKQITPGSVYVIEKGSDLWIKRLFYRNDNSEIDEFECISDNTMKIESGARQGKLAYPAFFIKIDTIRRLFKVTGIYKPNELTLIN